MSERGGLCLLYLAALFVLVLALVGCGGSYRDTRELVLPDLAARVSAPEVPIAASPLGVAATASSRKALQTCLLFPPRSQLQCILINL